MSECVRCKSKCKLPIFCNSCYQESFRSGERRGRVEELELIRKFNYEINNNTVSYTLIEEHCKKRLKELQGVEK